MAIPRLPTFMVTEYNGYTFNETVETTAYQIKMHYDSAGRTVTHCDHHLTLAWYIDLNAHDSSANVPFMIERLSAPAGRLKYKERGFDNDLALGGEKDIEYGPKPEDLTLVPHGGRVIYATWQVNFSIPVCLDARFDGIREWNFRVSYALDLNRNTTITTVGHLIIVGNRRKLGDKKVRDSADNFRELIVPPLRVNFRRASETYDLSESKLQLDYSVTDVQMGFNAPGNGLIDAKMSESVSNAEPKSQVAWIRNFDATYTVATGFNVKVAWDKFWATLRDRRDIILAKIGGATIVPITFFAEDPDVYGQNQIVHMRMSWYVIGRNATLADAVGRMGLWQPVPNSSWAEWVGTTGNVMGARGSAHVKFRVADDRIIDLCTTPETPTSIGDNPNKPAVADEGILKALAAKIPAIGDGALVAGAFPPGLFPKPKADASWLNFEIAARVVVDAGRALGTTLPTLPLDKKPPKPTIWDAIKDKLPASENTKIPDGILIGQGNSGSQSNSGQSAFVQQRVTPTVHVYVTGRATRWGYSIPQPQLVEVNGKEATLLDTGAPGEGFKSAIVSSALYPIVNASWNLHYVIPGLTSLDELPNSFFDKT